jgi:hypothetical protein
MFEQHEDEDQDIYEKLGTVLAEPEIWLETPNEFFGGRKPRKLIGTEDEGLLHDFIQRIVHGMVS